MLPYNDKFGFGPRHQYKRLFLIHAYYADNYSDMEMEN